MKHLQHLVLSAALIAPTAGHAVTVDFEGQASGAPAYIQPSTRSQTLTLSGATFAGGAVVVGTDDYLDVGGDFTAAYTTAPYTSFTNPITITFGNAVNALSFMVVNNISGNYYVSINGGANRNYALGDYANQTISLTGAINKVAIGYTSQLSSSEPYFDFAIDNVSFSPAAAVPEPSTWGMMIVGMLMTGAALRRRRAAAAASPVRQLTGAPGLRQS